MPANLQDTFLFQMRQGKLPASIYLMNGFLLKGVVKGFDAFTVLIEGQDGRPSCVYKHAISTISPAVDPPQGFMPELLRISTQAPAAPPCPPAPRRGGPAATGQASAETRPGQEEPLS